jgi:hypothetical protein
MDSSATSELGNGALCEVCSALAFFQLETLTDPEGTVLDLSDVFYCREHFVAYLVLQGEPMEDAMQMTEWAAE